MASPSEPLGAGLAEPGTRRGPGSTRSASRTLPRGFDRVCPSPLQGGVFQCPGHRRPPTNRGRPAQQHASVKGSAGVRAAPDLAAGRVAAGLPSGRCSPESDAQGRAAFPSGSSASREDGIQLSPRPPPRAVSTGTALLGTRPPQGGSAESRLPPSAALPPAGTRPDALSSGCRALPEGCVPPQGPSGPRAGAAAPAELAPETGLLGSLPFPASLRASALRAAARVVLPALGALAGPGPVGWAPRARRRGPAPAAPPCLQAPGFGGGR